MSVHTKDDKKIHSLKMSSLTKFRQDFHRTIFDMEKDGFFIAAYVIDNKTNTVEIEGETCLKSLLFNASPQVNSEWVNKSENRNSRGLEADLPEGVKVHSHIFRMAALRRYLGL